MIQNIALDPGRSVVVEACAGSGKTWLLVSRIVRLLLDGAEPSQILAITFTRKAAQEMQARLQHWLRDLAFGDDIAVRRFLAERGLDNISEEHIQRARGLYRVTLLTQPGITISTFHSWFIQVLRRAPLNADVMHGMSLLERPGTEQEAAWEDLLSRLQANPNGAEAKYMQWLFEECGLFNTRALLFNFLGKRAEWWSYTQGQVDALAFALQNLRTDLDVDLGFDPVADWGICGNNEELLFAFTRQLACNGTDTQAGKSGELERRWTDTTPEARFDALRHLLYTQADEPRSFKATRKQDSEAFLITRDALFDSLQRVRDTLAEQRAYRLNEAVLHCGVALLERYQLLKAQKQQMDFADLEWQLCQLLQHSEHAETMQYKLDSRYRHVLLDEFQDTNPLQWQILRAWFDAAVTADSGPTVFVVGDPKQSIYRFRRADARLFGVARDYLRDSFAAASVGNNITRRNAQPVVDAVNAVFREQPDGFEFVEHQTCQTKLPGQVLVLPLHEVETGPDEPETDAPIALRDPLTTAREEPDKGARNKEAEQFAALLETIAASWVVHDDGLERRACYRDVMVLVRNRTHLQVYEEALRARHIPFLSSRRGGLLDTLEAEDLEALLTFLITPFADLALAQALRTPIFACSDDDLMRLCGELEERVVSGSGSPVETLHEGIDSSWWRRLQKLDSPSETLRRAAALLGSWLGLADKLPVHDLLDRIYFEGDVVERYRAVLPDEMRDKVTANLHAFMEIALSVDAGRYPSLPRFLQELRELRDSRDDAPDEGKLGTAGDAVRIYTVHESKGLEAPIVWLLDANGSNSNKDGNDVLIDWPTNHRHPSHFSMYTDLSSRGKKRASLFALDADQRAREEMNLLYVAMTRARQVLIVSGNGRETTARSWYQRIADALPDCIVGDTAFSRVPVATTLDARAVDRPADRPVALPPVFPAGKRFSSLTIPRQRGIWLHALLQFRTESGAEDVEEFARRVGIPVAELDVLNQHADRLLNMPELSRYFDASQYRVASNEMAYVNAQGELKRIDRLVEFADEVWVLDYKLGERENAARYRAQLAEYRQAMQQVFVGKKVSCALLYADGTLVEL
jgi:ATP-dependent helicase/nuclease subunit A